MIYVIGTAGGNNKNLRLKKETKVAKTSVVPLLLAAHTARSAASDNALPKITVGIRPVLLANAFDRKLRGELLTQSRYRLAPSGGSLQRTICGLFPVDASCFITL